VTGQSSDCTWPLFGATVAKNQGSSHKDFPTTASNRRHHSEYAVPGPISIGWRFMASSDMSRVAKDDPVAADAHILR
jgi:hypothetical protein